MQWKYPYFSVIDVSVVEQSIVSTGPYKLDSMQAGVGAELSRNEYYWNGEVPYFTSCKRKSPAFAGLSRQAERHASACLSFWVPAARGRLPLSFPARLSLS